MKISGEIRARAALIGAAALCAAAAAGVTASAAGAVPSIAAYDASAGADGARVLISAPGSGPVDTPVDTGTVSTQATVNSLGTSTAYGAAPYPGDAALKTPGLAASLSGLPSPPPYPLLAFSAHPVTPTSTVDHGPYHLEAASSADRSAAMADIGRPGPGQAVTFGRSRATSSVEVAADRVTATSETQTTGIAVGEVLRVASVRAAALAVQSAGADLQRTSSVVVEGVSVAGTAVVLRQDGSPSAGEDVLSRAGIVLERLAPVETDHGVVSGALRITQTQTLPTGATTTVSVTLGQARASVITEPGLDTPGLGADVTPAPAATPPEPTAPEPDAAFSVTPAVPARPGAGSGISDSSTEMLAGAGPTAPSPGSAIVGTGGSSGSAETAAPVEPPTVALRPATRPALSNQAVAARRAAATTRLTGLYLAVFAAGLAGVALLWPVRLRKER